jgi:hypothetical protein
MTYGQDVVSYGQAAVIAVIVLFYAPAVAMVWLARHHRTTHPSAIHVATVGSKLVL